MSAREGILHAIRSAAVPAAPPAALPPPRTFELQELRVQFLRVLADVGGRGIEQDHDRPLDALLAELIGAEGADVTVVRGRFAVAENAAVYVDASDLAQRNDIVRRKRMIVIVSRDAVVPTMHEAVRLLPAGAGCGWFLSGPSKTADIEQALVYGAQGSREHLVILAH